MATVSQALNSAASAMSRADVGSPMYAASRQLIQSYNQGNQVAVVTQVAKQNAKTVGTGAAFGNNVSSAANDLKQQLNWLANNGGSTESINNIVKTVENDYVQTAKNIKDSGSPFGALVNMAVGAGTAMTLPGIGGYIGKTLGVSQATGTAIASFGLNTFQGQDPSKAFTESIATLSSAQVPEFLKSVGVAVSNQSAQAVIDSATKAYVRAELLNQNGLEAAKNAAIVSGATEAASSMTSSAGTGLKVPTAPQDKVGLTGNFPPTATGSGINPNKIQQTEGLIASSNALLWPSVIKSLGEAGLGFQPVGLTSSGELKSAYTSAGDIITPSSLSQYLPDYQAPSSTSGEMKRGLSAGEKAALTGALNLGLSYLRSPSGSGQRTIYSSSDYSYPYLSKETTTAKQTSLPVGQFSPGSQALGQALRIGDIGAPIFGTDKDKGKKSGWNVESLRYMGDVGEA